MKCELVANNNRWFGKLIDFNAPFNIPRFPYTSMFNQEYSPRREKQKIK